MFFVLSKTLNYFTAPLVIIVALFLLSAFLRNLLWKKRLFRTALILLFVLSNDIISNEVLLAWEIPATPFTEVKKHYQWGILLTGVTRSDANPPHDRVYFRRGADRVVHTLQLYKRGYIDRILISGGSGKLIDDNSAREADEMASVLRLMGVPDSAILIENTSRNTRENALNSVALLTPRAKASDCVLITSAFHLRRARACFNKLGWNMDTFSTDFLTHERNYNVDSVIVPGVDALLNWNILMKEWIGYAAYKIAGYI